jgi:hypothetical protein
VCGEHNGPTVGTGPEERVRLPPRQLRRFNL